MTRVSMGVTGALLLSIDTPRIGERVSEHLEHPPLGLAYQIGKWRRCRPFQFRTEVAISRGFVDGLTVAREERFSRSR